MTTKSKMWLRGIIILVLSVQFLGAAFAKLTGQMCEHFMANGLGYEFMMFIGLLEAISVLGLFIPATRVKASLIQMAIMCGAMYTHFQSFDVLMILVNITNIGLSSIVIWAELDKKYMSDEMLLKGNEI
ncbi:DoxX family protein [Fulvivirga lutea]|uniref:DoxX family protein n=1 Tax=Fulvivirga lutea TaxID=2810512 RepID=A0A974ZZ92_9BACT|nr:DoxX family protein [Fulvivirga lutea]QSE95859.1 DoxX family protein [Fulvivirga lutea]